MKLHLTGEEERILRRTPLLAKTNSRNSIAGSHTINRNGTNIEFNEYSRYLIGDELKDIDWKVAAKTEKYYIKRYHDDTSVLGYILLDHSKSMSSLVETDKNNSRFNAAIKIAFYLSNIYYFNNETLGYFSFSNNITHTEPTGSQAQGFRRIYNRLHQLKLTDGETSYAHSFETAAKTIKPSSEIYIISDFYCEIEDINKSLNYLKTRRCNINLINILDSNELNIDKIYPSGDYYFIDKESHTSNYFNAGLFKNRYKAELLSHLDELKEYCEKTRINYLQVFSDQPIFNQFLKLIK